MSSEKYIGLDVHQATTSVTGMDSQGKVIMESILETKALTILEFFAGYATCHARTIHVLHRNLDPDIPTAGLPRKITDARNSHRRGLSRKRGMCEDMRLFLRQPLC